MTNNAGSLTIRLGMLLALGALMQLLTSSPATAQWQKISGDYKCRDAGRKGVAPSSCDGVGGFISVGETFSPGMSVPGCKTTSDIYVVKTNPDGTIDWARQYDIGGNDSALDIKEVVYNGSGYIITGVTDNANGTCNYVRSAFLMRIDCSGNVQWTNTYSNFEASEVVGYSVLEARRGGIFGDFVVAGWRTRSGFPSHKDGFLLRTDANGFVRSSLYLDIPATPNLDQYFYDVTEANNGDIVAAGATGAAGGGLQGLLMRAPANLGAPLWARSYGGWGNEEFRSVIEAQFGAGQLVATGYSTTNANSRPQLCVVKTTSAGGFVGDATYWAPTELGLDEGDGYCIREATIIQGSGIGSPGDYIITGRAKWPVTGLGGDDALFLRVSAGLNLIRANKIYGGPNNEVGWSIAEDGGQGWGQPMGYIICGFTKSPLYWCNDPEDRYLVKTNTTAGSGVSCREKFGSISYAPLSLPLESVDLSYTTTTNRCSPFPSTIVPYSIYPVACNACTPGTRKTPDDLNDGGGHAGDAVAGVESDASANAGAITLFPNPTAGDRGFTIGASFDRAGEGTIVVSDMRGRVVYTATESYEAGRREIPVSTDGWAAGIYMVKLTAPGSVGTARVVVGDK